VEDERSAAFPISAPPQSASLADRGELVVGDGGGQDQWQQQAQQES
jgi:hypothetical protein